MGNLALLGAGPQSGSPYTPQAQALFAAMSVQPDAANKGYIDTLIRGLIATGVWARLDMLQIYAQGTQQAGNLNWINPALYTAIATNSPTWTANQGYTSNGTTSWTNSVYKPSINGVNFTANDASFFTYIRTNTTQTGADVGCVNTSGLGSYNQLYSRYTGNIAYVFVNDASGAGVASNYSNSDSRGMFLNCRTSSTACQTFKNGTSKLSYTAAVSSGGVPPNTQFAIGGSIHNAGNNPSEFSTNQISLFGCGASMSVQNAADLYTYIQAYMTSIGSQV